MIFGSVCSGIEAASVAWSPLGWRPAFFSEISKFPCAVLAHHYPTVPNLGDMRAFESWPDSDLDVICGGTPCQSFSVAGLREGIRDPRGALTRTFLEVVARYSPRWVLWENVPGVRSSDDGRALGAFFAGLGELGYGYAWASLDAQYRGLAQRRERVFVVASSRGWQRAAAVLFDAASMRGDSAPSREAWESVAGSLSARTSGSGGLGTDFDLAGGLQSTSGGADENDAEQGRLIAGTLQASGKAAGSATQQDAEAGLLIAYGRNNTAGPIATAAALSAKGGSGRMDFETETFVTTHALTAIGFDASEDGTGRDTPLVVTPFDETQITSGENRSNPQPGAPSHALARGARPPTIAFNARQDPAVTGPVSGSLDTYGNTHHGADAGELCPTLRAMGFDHSHANGGGQVSVAGAFGVRRLTPRECERLQGFPDDYTQVPYRGKPAKDGPRYSALGNSWAVPVVRWIGERIELVESILEAAKP